LERLNSLITISTNFYKNKIYKNLKIKRVQEDEQRPGFMDFPYDYPNYYFQMLTNEEQKSDGTFVNSGRNEALDIMVYNLCAAELYLDTLIQNRREVLIKNGLPRTVVNAKFGFREMFNELLTQRAKQLKKRT
jgi:phage terminase large subunit GpA-like protein